MTDRQLKNRISKVCRGIQQQAKRMRDGFDGTDVHDIRLEFKRLRALLDVLNEGVPLLDLPGGYKKLKKKYRWLGQFRLSEILAAQLKNSKRLSEPRRLAAYKAIKKHRRKAEKHLDARFFKKTVRQAKNFEKTLLKSINNFDLRFFGEWMIRRAKLLHNTDVTALKSEEAAHDFRRKLKHFMYNLEACGKAERRTYERLTMPTTKADTLQHSLGERHDRAVWQQFLRDLD
jgi:CHAD domain-containing protein